MSKVKHLAEELAEKKGISLEELIYGIATGTLKDTDDNE